MIRGWREDEAEGGGLISFSAGVTACKGECVQHWFVMLISGMCGIVNSSFMALVQELKKKKPS